VSDKNDHQCMRNFALKCLAAWLVQMVKFAPHVPEVREELEQFSVAAKEIASKIRANNPPGDGRVRERVRGNVRRIFVR
jgi:hypothetical protein